MRTHHQYREQAQRGRDEAAHPLPAETRDAISAQSEAEHHPGFFTDGRGPVEKRWEEQHEQQVPPPVAVGYSDPECPCEEQ